jgi:serine/threonine protein kinase
LWLKPMTAPGPGTSLQHFRLDRLLARGGMGEVYLGYDTSLERQVAVKLILPQFAKEPGFLDRFLREARAQARIAHSNVVQVYYVGIANEVVFMAMELVDGGDLASLAEKNGAFSWKEALTHLLGLAEGLKEAHRLGIIHRDIKPQNILLDRFGLAHLADFGLAAPVGSSSAQVTLPKLPVAPSLPKLTQMGTVMGTPAYMSPEQARGAELDQRSDIYALGACFYELLSGKAPTTAGTLAALQQFHSGPPPALLAQVAPHIPRPFALVIDRCMARDVSQRYADYDALIDALKAAAPRPMVTASSVSRVLAWAIDVSLFASVTRFTFEYFSVAGFICLVAWWFLGAALTGSSPGQWMMRLTLRTAEDQRVSVPRLLARFAAQHLWLLFAGLLLTSLYSSSSLTSAWAALTALFGLVSLVGSGLALTEPLRRTLVDRLTSARVLVDVR